MKKILLLFSLLCAIVAVSCSDSESKYAASGIGTVELNDSVFAIHYYRNALIIDDPALSSGLRDSARVFFSGSGSFVDEVDEIKYYSFHLTSISKDITCPLLMMDSVAQASADTVRVAGSAEGFFGQNIHITRDWRRCDFIDATAMYPGADDDSGDFFGFTVDPSTVGTDTIRIWLRLSRASTDSVRMVTKYVSTPIGCLQDSTRERVMVNLSRIDAYGDTVVSNMVYSYVNWIE